MELAMELGLESDVKLTPMMEQYRSVKKTLSADTVLFFRLGDFYEMFFEDAVRAADILNITLTGREAGKAGRIPMCGIPYHAAQGYLKTLVDHNLKVAICEQVGDPKSSKGLLERKINRIVSPATYLEADGDGKQFAYMVALYRQGAEIALACLELSTGDFTVREVPEERLLGELTLIRPREVIIPKAMAAETKLLRFLKEIMQSSLTEYEDWIFAPEEGSRLLCENFQWSSDRNLEFADQKAALGACGAILYYLKANYHTAIGHIRPPTLLSCEDHMVLDRQTQKSLELVENLSGEKNGPTLLKTLDQTVTAMGGRLLQHWVTHPLLVKDAIERRQQGVRELVEAPETLENLRQQITGVRDIERTLSRLNYGVANARDLVNLKLFLQRVPSLEKDLQTLNSAYFTQLVASVSPLPDLCKLIERAISDDAPLTLKEGGLIRDGYSAELDELRAIAGRGKSWLLEFEQREAKRTGIKKLKIKYSQVFGYMLEVSKANASLVPDDYVRRQTLANAERFITPELKEWDAKISGAQDKIKALEFELFNEIRAAVLQELTPLQAMARAIGALDGAAALALTARHKGWVAPQLDDAVVLEISGGRHPVVEAMLPAGEFVENDTTLDDHHHQLGLITGPNMAGKSTYIRQVAQIVILAQIGSFVPAQSARIGLVDRVLTRIGASDDLARGESTFMVEMVEMAHILNKTTARSLLILDEVGRGTATFDGVSIAWAICEHLASGPVRPRTLFATHYHELTQLEAHFPGIENYHITVRETTDGIIFLRRVAPGGSDRSYGIHVARLAGIPEVVTTRADEIMKILESENAEATDLIEGQTEKQAGQKSTQAELFTAPEHPLLRELGSLDINGLSPLEALNKLAKWKETLA